MSLSGSGADPGLCKATIHRFPEVATKLMEGDPENAGMMEGLLPVPVWHEIRTLLIQHEDSLHAVWTAL